ncbi:MAG: 3-hydroxybutyryl-CoA dehydrogenase [Planctomycetota bacterium]|nr:MAG: 3-hydroxybutyryl-CoA dehydrogenase [Planctomycetota bacterium]
MEHGVSRIGVVGAGQMGGGIAQVAAVSGFGAVVHDASAEALDRAKALHEKLLNRAVEKERMTRDEADAALARISYAPSLDGLAGCDWVVEAIVEDLAVKRELFGRLAQMFTDDRVALASNTSSISITALAAAANDAAPRVVGMHFFNPVPVMKLVEVIRGVQTADEIVARTVALAEAMGKTPLKANDRAGFVSNRVLMPMINEAFRAWMEGVAEPEAIDGIMTLGCNHPMGPLRLADFIGLDTCEHIMNVLHRELGEARFAPCPLLRQLVAAGRLGDKTGRGVYDHSKR